VVTAQQTALPKARRAPVAPQPGRGVFLLGSRAQTHEGPDLDRGFVGLDEYLAAEFVARERHSLL
jgi:hypothetical protein